MTTEDNFTAALDRCAADVEQLLAGLLTFSPNDGETMRPARLVEAMRYAALGGGKRLRPFLVLESAALFDVPREQALMVGAALECVHCYSLVHDDLPALDNDDLRRGRPTLHKAYDEATAIIAGDALLTFAFDLLARPETNSDPAIRVRLVRDLARAAGLGGMAGGQLLDLAAEGRFGATGFAHDEHSVRTLQSMKTGALLHFACCAGATLAARSATDREALSHYGKAIGLAFQIADDLLDAEGDSAIVGKATGKDAALGKATLVSLLGPAAARERLARVVAEAEAAAATFGARGDRLVQAARFVAERHK